MSSYYTVWAANTLYEHTIEQKAIYKAKGLTDTNMSNNMSSKDFVFKMKSGYWKDH